MVIVGHGGVVEYRFGGGRARVFEEEVSWWGGGVRGPGDAVVELFDDVGLVLRPGDVETFSREEAWDAMFAEMLFVVDLRAGQEGADLLVAGKVVIDAWVLNMKVRTFVYYR